MIDIIRLIVTRSGVGSRNSLKWGTVACSHTCRQTVGHRSALQDVGQARLFKINRTTQTVVYAKMNAEPGEAEVEEETAVQESLLNEEAQKTPAPLRKQPYYRDNWQEYKARFRTICCSLLHAHTSGFARSSTLDTRPHCRR